MGWTRINEFVAADGYEAQLSDILLEVTEYLLTQDGCQSAELLVSDEDDARLVVLERWATKEDHHQALIEFPKEKMARARNFIANPPRSEFFFSAGSTRGSVH